MTTLELVIALGGGIGLLWALAPALTAPRARKHGDGFEYLPPCPECGNIAVSIVHRYPVNESPARAYRFRCDHDVFGRWQEGNFCRHTFVMTHRAVMAMQPELERRRRLKKKARPG